MKRTWFLIRQEFALGAPGILITLALMTAVESALYMLRVADIPGFHAIRFERIVDSSGIPYAFALCLLLLVAYDVWTLFRNFSPTKSAYALMTLPMDRAQVYLAKLVPSAVRGICLWCAQYLMLLALHHAFSIRFAQELPQASFYLSLLRSPFLRVLYPPEIISSLATITALFIVPSFVMANAVHIKAEKYWPLPFIDIWVIIAVPRMYPTLKGSPGAALWVLLLLLCLLVLYVYFGLRPLRRGEVGL